MKHLIISVISLIFWLCDFDVFIRHIQLLESLGCGALVSLGEGASG